MGCPTQCILGQNLTFSIQAKDGTGAPVAATGSVAYAVYEDETATAILDGSMSQLASQTGFYSEQIECTADNGFERYKTYTVRVSATVSAVSVARTYAFICLGVEDSPTASTGALTTTANFKSYAGISHTDDDTLIGYLVSRATSAIEKYCERILRSDTYREWYDGRGDCWLSVDQYPITDIQMISKSKTDAFYITNTDADAWNAYVKITTTDEDSTALALVLQGGDNDGTDTLSFATRGTYTLTTLATAINAVGSGWSAGSVTSSYAKYDAMELIPVNGLQCKDSYAYVSVPDEPEYDFDYQQYEGLIYMPTGYPRGIRNITVRYTGGYVTTPADLEQICIDQVNLYYRGRKKDLSVKSEKLGDHSVTMADDARDLSKSIMNRLAPYRRITLG